jgi:two-component system chemotaxis response regulator CheB
VSLPVDPLRILIVDDSALYCQLVKNVLREVPDVDVVGTARSGQEALDQLDQLAPDLMTLDVRMPGGDGIDVLRELKKRRSRTKAIMLSSLTANGAQVTTDALMEGAFDFIHKPGGPDAAANRQALLDALREKIAIFRDSRKGRIVRQRPAPTVKPPVVTKPAPAPRRAGQVAEATAPQATCCEAILIGTSTGGPVALREVLGRETSGRDLRGWLCRCPRGSEEILRAGGQIPSGRPVRRSSHFAPKFAQACPK